MNTILFPTDFSEVSLHALPFAINYCKKANCKLLVLNIIDTPFDETIEEEKLEVDLLTKDLISFSDNKLNDLKNKIVDEFSFSIEVATYCGYTNDAIIRAVKNFRIKKIIMGTKANRDLFFRSSSFIIVKNSLIPLLTINIESPVLEIKNILFPFNEKMLTLKKADEVIKFAKLYDANIIFLGVSEANTPEKISIITNQMMYIKNLFDDEGVKNEVHFSSSRNYAEAIFDFCNMNKVDLITLANNHTDILKATLTFNSTKTIINKAHVPVLTIPVWRGI